MTLFIFFNSLSISFFFLIIIPDLRELLFSFWNSVFNCFLSSYSLKTSFTNSLFIYLWFGTEIWWIDYFGKGLLLWFIFVLLRYKIYLFYDKSSSLNKSSFTGLCLSFVVIESLRSILLIIGSGSSRIKGFLVSITERLVYPSFWY